MSKLKKCPVCKAECQPNDIECAVCGFPEPNIEFVSMADAEEWRIKTLEPCRAIWRKAQTYIHKLSESKVKGPAPSTKIYEGISSEFELQDLPDGSVAIKKFLGFETPELVIPGIIDGKNVTVIGAGAYKKCTQITSVIISDGIRHIAGEAFLECENLKTIQLPASLERIGEVDNRIYWGAFTRCTSLEQIICPENLQMIGHRTFSECASLKDITLNENLSFIGDGAFDTCASLTSIYVPKSVREIGKGVFECWERKGSSFKRIPHDITLYCHPGSYALAYARENNLSCSKAE